jgi:hypothetical protein
MTPLPRHQCLIYEGPPSRRLATLAAIVRQKLQQNLRCLYLNSEPMVAGMRSYLAAAGVDVAKEVEEGNLVLTSDRSYLVNGTDFDPESMIQSLEDMIEQALADGYDGLWATGDMTWEFGPSKDFSKLVEYEWRLEELFRRRPQLGGICQYHAETLPREVLQKGLLVHRGLFINETLSLINPHYHPAESLSLDAHHESELDELLQRICETEP